MRDPKEVSGLKERLMRLALAVAGLALIAFWGALGDILPNGLKWG